MDEIVGERLYGAGGDHASLRHHRAAVRGAMGKGHVLFNPDHGDPGLATMLGWRDARICPVLLPAAWPKPAGLAGARSLMAGLNFFLAPPV
jgi:hypothetical protein